MTDQPDDVVRAAADEFIRRQRLRKAGRGRAYLQLLRLPNVFTAMADVAMGFLFVQPISPPWHPTAWDFAALATLLAASSSLYLAGMVLNDVFDIEIDRRERPERPLPSGKVPLKSAQRLGWRLLVLGVALGSATVFFVGHFRPGVVAALLAVAIVLYDARLKRTPLGPLAMGTCRALNVILGMSAMDMPLRADHWLVAAGIGIYIAGVTWFARKEAGQSRPSHLLGATLTMLLGLGLIAWFPNCSAHIIPALRRQLIVVPVLKLRLMSLVFWYVLVGVLGILILLRSVRAMGDPTPLRVQRVVAECLLLLVVIDGLICYATSGAFCATMIMALLVPTIFFARRIRTT